MNQTQILRPATPGDVLFSQFMKPNRINQTVLAAHTGWSKKHVNRLCHGKVAITINSALILAKAFDNKPDFWMDLQKKVDLWDALHSESCRSRIDKVRPFQLLAA